MSKFSCRQISNTEDFLGATDGIIDKESRVLRPGDGHRPADGACRLRGSAAGNPASVRPCSGLAGNTTGDGGQRCGGYPWLGGLKFGASIRLGGNTRTGFPLCGFVVESSPASSEQSLSQYGGSIHSAGCAAANRRRVTGTL
jgi:hypothetical protein